MFFFHIYMIIWLKWINSRRKITDLPWEREDDILVVNIYELNKIFTVIMDSSVYEINVSFISTVFRRDCRDSEWLSLAGYCASLLRRWLFHLNYHINVFYQTISYILPGLLDLAHLRLTTSVYEHPKVKVISAGEMRSRQPKNKLITVAK